MKPSVVTYEVEPDSVLAEIFQGGGLSTAFLGGTYGFYKRMTQRICVQRSLARDNFF